MQTRRSRFGKEVNPVELLSACGTFLTAMAALVSVTVIILDEPLQLFATVLVGCAWLSGATMQISAGAIARLRAIRRSVG
jgi:Zn-dependent alcohol dehydrogenase